jgi:hypothetical protein
MRAGDRSAPRLTWKMPGERRAQKSNPNPIRTVWKDSRKSMLTSRDGDAHDAHKVLAGRVLV